MLGVGVGAGPPSGWEDLGSPVARLAAVRRAPDIVTPKASKLIGR